MVSLAEEFEGLRLSTKGGLSESGAIIGDSKSPFEFIGLKLVSRLMPWGVDWLIPLKLLVCGFVRRIFSGHRKKIS